MVPAEHARLTHLVQIERSTGLTGCAVRELSWIREGTLRPTGWFVLGVIGTVSQHSPDVSRAGGLSLSPSKEGRPGWAVLRPVDGR
jgi:hypothetical protein